MSNGQFLGVAWVLLGGMFNGSFILPMKRMKAWSWENIWLAYSVLAMVLLPWAVAFATVPNLIGIYHQSSWSVLVKVVAFGFGWGVGSTFFGLGVARIGMALGYAIVLGITASFGSLLPLIILSPDRLLTQSGYKLIAGTLLVMVGLAFLAMAGRRRERESGTSGVRGEKSGFPAGMLICVLSGLFSAMLNFSFVFGKELSDRSLAGAGALMSANSIWAPALSAGFLANAGYCAALLKRNRTWRSFAEGNKIAYPAGILFMGSLWYGAIVVYGVGAANLGTLGGIVGWPLLMTMTVITANFWGAVTGEWSSASRTARYHWWRGIAILLLALYVISLGGTG